MSDPWTAALQVMFNGPGSEAAVYWNGAGEPTPIRVIRSRPDRLVAAGNRLVLPAADAFDIQASEVPRPAIGDVIEITEGRFAIAIEPVGDVEGVSWSCGAEQLP